MAFPNSNLYNVTFPNDTSSSFDFHWTPTAIFETTHFCIGLVGNVFLLVLILTDQQLRTPFNTYIIGLALANLIILTATPWSIWSALTSTDGAWPAGEAACSYLMYLYCVECSVIYYQHVLIAVSRMWAIIHPISYRNRHSKRLAQGLVIGVWVFVHAFMLPFWVRDTLYYRRSLAENRHQCLTNDKEQFTYSVIGTVTMTILPVLVQIMVFPVVYFVKKARTINRAVVAPGDEAPQLAQLPQSPLGTVLPTTKATSLTLNCEGIYRTVVEGGSRSARTNQSGLVLLGIMSLCALISWAPTNGCYFLVTLMPDLTVPDIVFGHESGMKATCKVYPAVNPEGQFGVRTKRPSFTASASSEARTERLLSQNATTY
ncbi:hypothetical protein BV898_19069 [Hypsibius exemplaris]|uniref:G-protein coupled receptors family 1 profile domain-containing protein n=1 Tax=Hypsibius exemplaris TaxID=2072580 RepID=A0A9X6NIM1_HYPEX|nr:hypothetical protein BV898_19069 [Hypsibius exemplaris]